MATVKFNKLSVATINMMGSKTRLKASNKKTLTALSSRVLVPIASNKAAVDKTIKTAAIKLLGEINEQLDDPNLPAELSLETQDSGVWANGSENQHRSDPPSFLFNLAGLTPAQAGWQKILEVFGQREQDDEAINDVFRYIQYMIANPNFFPPFIEAVEKGLVGDSLLQQYHQLVKYFSANSEGVPLEVLKYLNTGIKPLADTARETVRLDVVSEQTAVETKAQMAWTQIITDFENGRHQKAIDRIRELLNENNGDVLYYPPFPTALEKGLVQQDLAPRYNKMVDYFRSNQAGIPNEVLAFLGIDNASLPPLEPISIIPDEPTALEPTRVVTTGTIIPDSRSSSLADQLKSQAEQTRAALGATLKTAEADLAGLKASLEATRKDLQKFNEGILSLIQQLESEQARTEEENQHFSPEKTGATLRSTTECLYNNESVPPNLADSLLPSLSADPRLAAINRRNNRWNWTVANIGSEIEELKTDAAAWQAGRQEKIALLSEAIAKQQALVDNLNMTIKALLA
ncbi:MAG: hypothetical protein ABIH50_04865 [bacterium]